MLRLRNDLIKRTFFQSPLYTQKLKKEELEEEGVELMQTLHYGNCKKDKFPNWLSKNTFDDLRNTYKEDKYLFLGGEGVLCRIALRTTQFTGGEFLSPS